MGIAGKAGRQSSERRRNQARRSWLPASHAGSMWSADLTWSRLPPSSIACRVTRSGPSNSTRLGPPRDLNMEEAAWGRGGTCLCVALASSVMP